MKTKISQLTIASAVGSIMVSGLVAAIAIPQTKASIAQIAQALAPEEVNLRAKQIIVRIDGASVGSGSIIEHNGDRYKVLTNWHVIQNEGGYTVQTIDGRKHEVIPESIQQLGGVDLAVLEFTSSQNYQTAELGNSGNANEGQTVYFAGYPGELRREDNRYYRFFTANLVGILPKATENGYSLVYNGEAFPGMSGGPVFNQEGLVIGVHGEANVAFTGGTSNYAIPIAKYQQAMAQQTAENNPTSDTAQATPPAATSEPEVPEVIVEEPPQPKPEAEANTTEQPDSTEEQGTTALNSENISSVPTFSPTEQPASQSEPKAEAEVQQPESESSSSDDSESTESVPEPEVVKEPKESQPEVATAAQPETETETETVEVEQEEVNVQTATRKIALVSPKTGIDYTKLRDLLKESKWSEADLHTYNLVEQIVKSAKLNNRNTFIELKTIAEYSCSDIRTVDSLWKKYSNDRFGFSQQQSVWKSVNQKGDFSTETWRRFATKVGWKTGEVNSSSGYLLYDQLDFEPNEAPAGHLPWWFALADEEQKVIKSLFARCNLSPTLAELEAEEQNSDTAQNPGNNDNRRRDSNNSNQPPNVDKKPEQND